MRTIITLTILLSQVYSILAQTQPSTLPRLYFFSPTLLNPAMAGLDDNLDISVLHQRQMVQIPGGPYTQAVSVTKGIPGFNIGIGANIYRDQNGPLSLTGAEGVFSYKVNYDKDAEGVSKHYVSFGLSAGVQLWQLNMKDLSEYNADPVFLLQNESKPGFSASFGMLYYYEGFQGGFSVQNLAGGKIRPLSAFDDLQEEPIGFFLIGFENKLGEHFQLNPQAVISLDFSGNIQADLNLIGDLSFDSDLSLGFGTGYRMASRYKDGKPESLMFYTRTSYKGFNLAVQYNYPTGNSGIFTGGEYTIGLGITAAAMGGSKKSAKETGGEAGSEN